MDQSLESAWADAESIATLAPDIASSIRGRATTRVPAANGRHGFAEACDNVTFAHPAERHLARIFTHYGLRWIYEPEVFHLVTTDDGLPLEQVRPDFYLPDQDLFVELTTMRQSHVTRKNRKIRKLRSLFPEVQLRILYRRDYERLIATALIGTSASRLRAGRPWLSSEQVCPRIHELAALIPGLLAEAESLPANGPSLDGQVVRSDWKGLSSVRSNGHHGSRAPISIVGVGWSSWPFVQDLAAAMPEVGREVLTTLVEVSPVIAGQPESRVRVAPVAGAGIGRGPVVVATGIVSTGLTIHAVLDWLRDQDIRCAGVVTLLDRASARIIDVPGMIGGFIAPPDLLTGYALDAAGGADDPYQVRRVAIGRSFADVAD